MSWTRARLAAALTAVPLLLVAPAAEASARPVAHLGVTTSGLRATASSAHSTAPAGLASLTISWGDKTPTVAAHSLSATKSHTYAKAGRYTVTLRLVDRHHKTSTVSKAVTVGALSATALAPFVDSWGAHEFALGITKDGVGKAGFADLYKCPSCSFADAPHGSYAFRLSAISHGVATGRITASTESQTARVGDSVRLHLASASPGTFLEVSIAGRSAFALCNSTSAGQCGA